MGREQTCCFTGHRQIPDCHLQRLRQLVYVTAERLVAHRICNFCAGGALGFDTLAAQEVIYLREQYPQIRLSLILPCKDQCRGWKPEEIAHYQKILSEADEVIWLSEHYYRGCMQVRNQNLVDRSRYCVSYCSQQTGGTAYTVNYAKRQGCTIISLADLL